MPGTTDSQLLPFDYLDEVVSSVPVKNFADAVALKIDAKDTQRTAALTRGVALAYRAANQSIAHNAATSITFDTEEYDSSTYINIGTQPTRITIPASLGGVYFMVGSIQEPGETANTTAQELTIWKNGTTTGTLLARRRWWGPCMHLLVTGYADLVPTDFLTLAMLQQNASAAARNSSLCYLRVYRVTN